MVHARQPPALLVTLLFTCVTCVFRRIRRGQGPGTYRRARPYLPLTTHSSPTNQTGEIWRHKVGDLVCNHRPFAAQCAESPDQVQPAHRSHQSKRTLLPDSSISVDLDICQADSLASLWTTLYPLPQSSVVVATHPNHVGKHQLD
jgi:hypothetical protein